MSPVRIGLISFKSLILSLLHVELGRTGVVWMLIIAVFRILKSIQTVVAFMVASLVMWLTIYIYPKL